MFNYFKFRHSLWKLDKWDDKVTKRFGRELKVAGAEGKSREDMEGIKASQYAEYSLIEDEREELYTRYLLRLCRRFNLPVPSQAEDPSQWTESAAYQSEVLSDKGIFQLRNAIRQERRAIR